MAVKVARVPRRSPPEHRTSDVLVAQKVNRNRVLIAPGHADVRYAQHDRPLAGNDLSRQVPEARARLADRNCLRSASAPAAKAMRIAHAKIDDSLRFDAGVRQLDLYLRDAIGDVERSLEQPFVVVTGQLTGDDDVGDVSVHVVKRSREQLVLIDGDEIDAGANGRLPSRSSGVLRTKVVALRPS